MIKEFSFVSYRTTKKRLLKQLRPFDKREFRRLTNKIIAENRGISITDARSVKFLASNEVILLLGKIGEPLEGYGKEISFDCTRLTKYQLFTKIPYISGNALRRRIVKIIMENRDIPFQVARYQKHLYSNEVALLFAELGESVPEII